MPGIVWSDGTCWLHHDPELWFDAAREEEAREVCNGCAIRHECLQAALERNERIGVWGGRTAEERRRMVAYTNAAGGDVVELSGRRDVERLAEADRGSVGTDQAVGA